MTRVCEDSVLLLVFDGVLRFEENGQQKSIRKGEYYIQQAYLPQAGVEESDCPQYYYLHFNGAFTQTPSLKLHGKWDQGTMLPLCREMEEVNRKQGNLLQKSLLFYRILDELNRYNALPISPSVRKTRDRIDSDYAQPLTVAELASEAGLSVNHLISLFAKEYGITPHRYLSRLRLREAEKLLRATTLSEEEIAFSVGFSDFSVFYKAFIKAYGYAPKAVRKRAFAAQKTESVPKEKEG